MKKLDLEVLKNCKKLFDRKLEQILEDRNIECDILGYEFKENRVEITLIHNDYNYNASEVELDTLTLDQKLFIDTLD